MFVPAGQQLAVIYGNGEGDTSLNKWFRIVYIGSGILFVVYNTLYPLLNLKQIHRYRQFIVNYSADIQRTSLNWLAIIQVLILVTVPGPLAGLLLGIPLIATSYSVLVGAVPYFINYLILCYNLLDNNYLIIQPEVPAQGTEGQPTVLDREHFERYLCEKKPYLNPKLRIIDLAAELNTNRSYISGFINREYNMNFCRLVNYYRLKELDRLRQLPANATKTNIDLVLMSGFSSYRSYRSYLKTKEEGDKITFLK
ncbi:helix-turn-helix domain-containing protein [Parabacteroides pacaensis]|uniref:AraC family transcriptional regulator n=1 Tax=Parabacteroides pacaensis TaxID=2086575 RepID=UPI000D0E4B29|nr:AraC family transcriptional regulator [Parabacteroides pacaensis]